MEGNGHSHAPDRYAQYKANLEQGLVQRIEAQRGQPTKRVLRAADRVWDGATQPLIDLQNGFDDRAIATFLRRIAPCEKSEIHRHNFEAVGYVVKGRGYEIHDGERFDWAEGDAVFIPANVWHQHVNADPDNEAIVLLITNWPLLLHLGITSFEPAPTWEEALNRPTATHAPKYPVSANT